MAKKTYLVWVLGHEHIIRADGGDEQNGTNTVEGLDTLAPLGTLAADVDHAVRVVLELEDSLNDADGSRFGVQDVLVGRHVVWAEQPVDVAVVHEVGEVVGEHALDVAQDGELQVHVGPQVLEAVEV